MARRHEFKTDPNAVSTEGVENLAPVAEARREHDGWGYARLWDSMDMEQRLAVLKEADINVNEDWWKTCVPEYTTYDQLLYDISVLIAPVLKKRAKANLS